MHFAFIFCFSPKNERVTNLLVSWSILAKFVNHDKTNANDKKVENMWLKPTTAVNLLLRSCVYEMKLVLFFIRKIS